MDANQKIISEKIPVQTNFPDYYFVFLNYTGKEKEDLHSIIFPNLVEPPEVIFVKEETIENRKSIKYKKIFKI